MGEKSAFENTADQLGFCGIWCGSCVAGNGSLQVLTQKYRALTEAYGLKSWAPQDFDYAEFAKGLKSIQDMPTCPGCLQGGGDPECVMRKCAQQKKLSDCTLCPESECPHAEALNKMRLAARAAGLIVKDKDADAQELIKFGILEIRTGWPSALLFKNDD